MGTATTSQQEQVRSAVMEGNRRFVDAIARGDADAVGELYTEDARVLPADNPMVEGKAAARAFWAGAIQQLGLRRAQLDTIDIESSGDLACEVGRFTLTIQPPGADVITARGKYAVVWKHVGDEWKLHVDIWNSDAPGK
jgi:ketosteroid isomerase-like protein